MAKVDELQRLGRALVLLEFDLKPDALATGKVVPGVRDRLSSLAEEAARLASLFEGALLSSPPRDVCNEAHGAAGIVLKTKRCVEAALAPASRRPLAPALDRVEKALRRAGRVYELQLTQLDTSADDAADFDFVGAGELAGPHGPGGGSDD